MVVSRKGALWVAACALCISEVPIDTRRVASNSMAPTIHAGDWVIVQTCPLWCRMAMPVASEHTLRNRVVVVAAPQGSMAGLTDKEAVLLVKRVVGVAGDTLQMRDALLYINGIVERPAHTGQRNVPDEASSAFAWQKSLIITHSRFGYSPGEASRDNWGPLVIPPGKLFLLGDNRYHSNDSRYFGLVPVKMIRGFPRYIYATHRESTKGPYILPDSDQAAFSGRRRIQ
ncbi:MAG: signal peptidase [Gemmatimonadetes bacterium]|nr:signal peptidase [Gemmatimonadota bacterium]